MAEFRSLFEKYDKLVLFDTETTGLQYARDEIIEFAAVVVEQRDGTAVVTREYDELVTLSPGNTVPFKICSKIKRCLTSKLSNNTYRFFFMINTEHIFKCQRFEIKLIGSVIVG